MNPTVIHSAIDKIPVLVLPPPPPPPPPPPRLITDEKALADTDDVVHPLLFAAETKNPRIVQISLTSLQKLMQYKAIPQVGSHNL